MFDCGLRVTEYFSYSPFDSRIKPCGISVDQLKKLSGVIFKSVPV